jgi:hypothetical protein
MRQLVHLLFLTMLTVQSQAQISPVNTGDAILVHASYGYIQPGGDLADRFGSSLSPGLRAEWLFDSTQWFAGVHGAFFFGNRVKQDVLSGLRTTDGGIIGNDRSFADVQLRMRAWLTTVYGGKVIPLGQGAARSGIRLELGLGYFRHKIRIQDDPSRSVAPLSEAYKKGYDRLSAGIALHQSVGYQYLSADGRINFALSFECTQARTEGLRGYQYDLRGTDNEQRTDVLFGLRATWILPFYVTEGEAIYY